MQRLIPRKGDFLMRAHINPFNTPFFPFPPHPSYVDWKLHFPLHYGGDLEDNFKIYCNTDEHPCSYDKKIINQVRNVDFLDIGCGYGGLLFGLAPLFPTKLIFGLEIRNKLVNYSAQKIRAYRQLYPNQYDHISVVRANSMKHLCHYFTKASIQKIFICFPDPHFKTKNFKRRIVNTGFLSEYAYLLKQYGRIYCITDVEDLHSWHIDHLQNHSQFRKIDDSDDECINIMMNNTEQGQRVSRNKGNKYWTIFERI